MAKDRMRNILIGTWALLVVVCILSFVRNQPIWTLDAVVLGLVLSGLYLLRHTLNLTDFVFLLLAGSVLVHCLGGVLGAYEKTFFGSEFDSTVHSYNSFVIGLAAFGYTRKVRAGIVETAAMAMLIALGIGLFNELVEYAGYRIGGMGDGLFLFGPGDIGVESAFDNLMTDFFHDVLGNAAGIAAGTAWWAVRRRGKTA